MSARFAADAGSTDEPTEVVLRLGYEPGAV